MICCLVALFGLWAIWSYMYSASIATPIEDEVASRRSSVDTTAWTIEYEAFSRRSSISTVASELE